MNDKISLQSVTGISPERRKYETSKEFILSRCSIGIEIEVENIRLRTMRMGTNTHYWKITNDGSLRNNGVEFISEPVWGEDINKALDEIQEILKDSRTTPDFSERTSLHIHLDVRNLNTDELFNLVMLVIVFERVLVRYCGGDREDNVFAIPFYKAERGIRDLPHLVSGSTSAVAHVLRSAQKYIGCNIAPVARLGTVEFRYHGGTADKERIKEWINIIYCFKRYARRIKDIEELPTAISQMGINKFMRSVFRGHADVMTYNGIHDDVIEGIRLAQDAIYDLKLPKKYEKTTYNDRLNVVANFHKIPKIKSNSSINKVPYKEVVAQAIPGTQVEEFIQDFEAPIDGLANTTRRTLAEHRELIERWERERRQRMTEDEE